jgi:undecaprenyl-diphosphatase
MTHPAADISLFRDINDFARHTSWLHGDMTVYAKDGAALFVVLIGVAVWLAWRGRSGYALAAAGWAGLGTLLAVAINQPIVNAVAEKRPYLSLPHVELLISRSADFGFPSDHATMAGAVATGLLFASRRLGIVAWCAGLLLAHYPQAVLAGLALGALVSGLGWLLIRPAAGWLIGRLLPGWRPGAASASRPHQAGSVAVG